MKANDDNYAELPGARQNRKAYATPVLSVYGNVKELVNAGVASVKENEGPGLCNPGGDVNKKCG